MHRSHCTTLKWIVALLLMCPVMALAQPAHDLPVRLEITGMPLPAPPAKDRLSHVRTHDEFMREASTSDCMYSEIPGEWVAEAIEQYGGVRLNSCWITGEVVVDAGRAMAGQRHQADASQTKASATIEFTECRFSKGVSIAGVQLDRFSISGCHFEADLSLADAMVRTIVISQQTDNSVMWRCDLTVRNSEIVDSVYISNSIASIRAEKCTIGKLDFETSKIENVFLQNCGVTGEVVSNDCLFTQYFDVTGTRFEDYVDFRRNQFDGITYFTGCDFRKFTTFAFSRLHAVTLDFNTFRSDVDFGSVVQPLPAGDNHNPSFLEINNSLFEGKFSVRQAQLQNLRFGNSPVGCRFADKTFFTDSTIDDADLRETEFKGNVDFSGVRFNKHLAVVNCWIDDGMRMAGVHLPYRETGGVDLQGTQIGGEVRVDWSQFIDRRPLFAGTKLTVETPTVLGELANVFRRNGNSDAEVDFTFRRQLVESRQQGGWHRVGADVSHWFWGFGLRPSYVFGWMCVIFFGFAAVYFLQARKIGLTLWRSWLAAIRFGWRTSIEPFYGIAHSNTFTYRLITFVHGFGFKLLILCWLHAVANTSPVLKEILGKLIPF